jgi:hypothetical protein
MPQTGSRLRTRAPLIAVLLLGTALGGCNPGPAPDGQPSGSGSAAADAAPATLPLTTSGPTTLVAAPPPMALPVGRQLPLRRLANRRQGYGWLDRANYQEEAFANAPPDYSFDQDGVRPWTWASRDGARVITEPVAGGYRTYYYDQGAQEPYLVRDPRNAYAYENGALIGVFAPDGTMFDPQQGTEQAIDAARYHERARALWRNAQGGQRMPVNAHVWGDRRADLSAQRMTWQSHQTDNPDWSSWHNDHGAQERGRWDDVRAQHQQAAQQFDSWQQQQYQGPPPQFYGDGGQVSDNRHTDRTAAIVGGVAVGAIAATLVHSLFGGGHDRNPAPQPVAAPQPPRQPAMAPAPVAPTYGQGRPDRTPAVAQPYAAPGQAPPQYVAPRAAPQPAAPRVAPQYVAPRAAPPPAAARVAPQYVAPRAAPQPVAPRVAPQYVAPRAAPPPAAPRVMPQYVAPRAAPQPVAPRVMPQLVTPHATPAPVAPHVVAPPVVAHPVPPRAARPSVPAPDAAKKPVPPADGQPRHQHEHQGPN